MNLHHWVKQILNAWSQPARRRRRTTAERRPAVGCVQILESRQMLSVNVAVRGDSVVLTDLSRGTNDSFDVAYTATQIKLMAHGGTQFRVHGDFVTQYTIATDNPVHLAIRLRSDANTVNITGDGTARLESLSIQCGRGGDGSSVTLNKVKVDGNAFTSAHDINVDHSTFGGRARVVQRSDGSTFDATASTFNGPVVNRMGADGVVTLHTSTDGPNRFHDRTILIGNRRDPVTLNTSANAATNDVEPRLINVNRSSVTLTPPTVQSVTAGVPSTVTGTWDALHATTLTVTVGANTFRLGADSQLTAPTTGTWSLNVSSLNLPLGATNVTVVNADSAGHQAQGTGTITVTTDPAQLASIRSFLTANQLSSQQTSSGLNYVITTTGTGAIPTANQEVTVNYTGFLLNSNGTLGTKFDSNVDPQFGHVQPFQFTLGAGEVIKGWDEAFALLPVGTVAKLLIPSSIGYGASVHGNIPANSILEFDVTLVSAQ